MGERLATQTEIAALRRALKQADVDERRLYGAGRIGEHDALCDVTLMGTMDRAIEGRPIDPALLRQAMDLLAHHHSLARGLRDPADR